MTDITFIPMILIWTFNTHFRQPYDLPSDPYKLSNCVFTNNRSYLSQSHIILFHWFDLNPNDLPSTRDSSQLWIILNSESPVHFDSGWSAWYDNKSILNDVHFNLTASYRADSDLYLPYGNVIPRSPPKPTEEMAQMERLIKDKIEAMSKLPIVQIVWVKSYCTSQSKGEKYVEELAKLMPVDVYGGCGNLTCGSSQRDTDCFDMIEWKYFFYLSFEDSWCNDYVTEKAFNILAYNIVPIVFGGANYSRILPPHSYIDASVLKPSELAFHLKSVLQSSQKYIEYLKWKRDYEVLSWRTKENQTFKFLTTLCEEIHRRVKWELLNDSTFKPIHNTTSKTLKQIVDWFTKEQCFVPGVTKWSTSHNQKFWSNRAYFHPFGLHRFDVLYDFVVLYIMITVLLIAFVYYNFL